MKICIVSDNLTAYKNKGGAEVQLLNTIEILKKNGNLIIMYDNNPETILDCDVVHFFKSLSWYWPIAQFCLKNKKPYFVSSIFFINDFYNLALFFCSSFLSKPGFLSVSNILKLWENAEYVFPNTTVEGDQVMKYSASNIAVIPNCIDDAFIEANISTSVLPDQIYQLNKPYVLNIGRIEKRKNQLMLARVCYDLNIPLVLVGPNNDDDYFTKVLKFSNVIYLGEIWDVKIKKLLLNYCRVFAMPSMLETPGIAALEAKYLKKNIILTKFGVGSGYFDDYERIRFVHPSSYAELRRALKVLYAFEYHGESLHSFSFPTYANEISRILKFYEKAL